MAIRHEYLTPSTAAQLGTLAGRAEAQRTETGWAEERAREKARVTEERNREQARQAIAIAEKQREVALAIQRENNTNEMNKFRLDMELVAGKRAQMYHLEQIETTARLTDEREQRKRIQLQDELDNGIKTIRESPILSDVEKEDAVYRFTMKKQYDYQVPAEKTVSPRDALIQQLMAESNVPTTAATPAPTTQKTWGWPTLTKPAYRVRSEQPAEATSIKMQSAPDPVLDSYWPTFTDKQKQLVWQKFNEGVTVEQILSVLGK
ncbi:MAG: hypothetical protein MUP81_03395 [Dehalococcoidia bacterium]|nr:hypothetical protein [Dehalococcoidia bacterium]